MVPHPLGEEGLGESLQLHVCSWIPDPAGVCCRLALCPLWRVVSARSGCGSPRKRPLLPVVSLLLLQVAQEIWVCEKQTISKWEGDILSYKEHLKSKLAGEEPQLTKRTHDL